MNKIEYDIMNIIVNTPIVNQRNLAKQSGFSLGKVNQSLKSLQREGLLDSELHPTVEADIQIGQKRPRNAVILAAGYGMRMVPINAEIPKGLLQIREERLIERLIRQLHEVGITEIKVVVGFRKEEFEYLMDEYQVELVVNPEYGTKNNLYSLGLVRESLGNTYIVPCDLWCKDNPFHEIEWYSWYMIGEEKKEESTIRVNRKMEIVPLEEGQTGNQMIGISYLLEKDCTVIREKLAKGMKSKRDSQFFWEETLWENGKFLIYPRIVKKGRIIEINTYEELREIETDSEHLRSLALEWAAFSLKVEKEDLTGLAVMKKGMTNRSFRFSCNGKQYIMRIPGEGTDQLIDRRQEWDVYQTIKPFRISDPVCNMDPATGYKLTEYLEGARLCDPLLREDVKACMKVLRGFHEKKLQVAHTFDLFGQILYYEELRKPYASCYHDYDAVKEKVWQMKSFIDEQPKDWCLTHIDAVPDNFLFWNGEIHLIDWEYAGMQDPHLDIAMFAIYAMYDRKQTEALIDLYFPEGCLAAVRRKIYCYMAVAGLLWSNWCEYKRIHGVEFGSYSLRQYRYAKEYTRIFEETREGEKKNEQSK